MADRVLSRYTEPTVQNGMIFTLEVERSSAGRPGLLFSIDIESEEGVLSNTCVVVEDGNEFLAPVIAWLNQ